MTSVGEVLAVMGGSGSGKTCTLDALAFRTPPKQTRGRICINERTCDRETARSFIGSVAVTALVSLTPGRYVVQHDKLMPNLTVFETLYYAAQLRHLESRRAVEQRTSNVLQEMELTHIRDSRVGDEYVRGISGGQRRRSASPSLSPMWSQRPAA